MRSLTLSLFSIVALALPVVACDYGMTGAVGVPLAAPAVSYYQSPLMSPYYAPTVPLASVQFAPSYSFAAQTYAAPAFAPAFAPSYAPAFAPAFAPFASSYSLGASSYGLSAFAAPSYSYSAFTPAFSVRGFRGFSAFSPGVSVDVFGGRRFNTFGGRTVIRGRFR